jgi:hypothetical protein
MKKLLESLRLRIGALLVLATASLLWTKLAPAAGFLTLVAWLALPKLETRARRLAYLALSAATLLSMVGFTRFVLSEAIPGVIAGGQAAATKQALAFARSVITAQDHVRQTAALDHDGDGVGSAVGLPALAGLRPLRNGSWLKPSPLYLRKDQIVDSPEGPLVRNGAYLYKLCLPTRAGKFVANPQPEDVDDEAAEKRYLLYAWPSVFGAGGPKQALFLDEHEAILVLDPDEEGRARYHGISNSPPCDTALEGSDWNPWKDKQPRTTLPGGPKPR